MPEPRGFLEVKRQEAPYRDVALRVRDYAEVDLPMPGETLREQAKRCMDCGVPFCHSGCPLGNIIPRFNDLVRQGNVEQASLILEQTNNFPEITGRVCPAPCEASCVLNLQGEPVTIKAIERAIGDHNLQSTTYEPRPARHRTGRRVAVIGSGPAGLAAAQQLARKGHDVVVYEQSSRLGGLLTYGIPDFKLEKSLIERRIAQMRAEGVTFVTGMTVGTRPTGHELLKQFHEIILCVGAWKPRTLHVPGSNLKGVHYAMDYLTQQNRIIAGEPMSEVLISAHDKRVIVIGGGDTGSDCVGTAHRQGAREVISLQHRAMPPHERAAENPWPEWPLIYRSSSSHDEGGVREFAIHTQELVGNADGHVTMLRATRADADGRPRIVDIACDLVLLAMGFQGVVAHPLLEQLGVALDARQRIPVNAWGQTANPRVYAAGDAVLGASLVVSAIAEGRKVAEAVHNSYCTSLSA